MQKAVNKIVTNLKEPGEAKQPDESPLFDIYKAFSTPAETLQFTQMLADGLAWGEAKKFWLQKLMKNWLKNVNVSSSLTHNHP